MNNPRVMLCKWLWQNPTILVRKALPFPDVHILLLFQLTPVCFVFYFPASVRAFSW